MKELYELASGKLSYLPSNPNPVVHLDPVMKGRHFDIFSLNDRENYERTCIAILQDLMDENPETLSMQEFYHVWMYVKVSTMGSNLKIRALCPKKIRIPSGKSFIERACETELVQTLNLVDSDIVRCPSTYQIPTIKLDLGFGETTYFIRPPRMVDEINLLTWFQEQGHSRSDLHDVFEHKDIAYLFSKHRMVLHLHDSNGTCLFATHNDREKAVSNLLENISLPDVLSFTDKVQEVSKFGIKTHSADIVCPSCKGKVSIPLPLSAGLAF